MGTRVMIIGSGGREHALAWRLAQDGAEILACPGNPGIATLGRCVPPVGPGPEGFVKAAKAEQVDLLVVGPEQPLVDGVADIARAAGIPVFGPSAAAARLEGSKVVAKAFMERHRIPTARCQIVTDPATLRVAFEQFDTPPVVKADGLAAGKGVVVAETFDEAHEAARQCLVEGAFGSAGAQVVLEQRLHGQEVSLFVITDGERGCLLAPAQDHKRLLEGDRGPNTGGMGAYVPAPIFGPDVRRRALERIVMPSLSGLAGEGTPFVGVLFIGLMIDQAGDPWVIEYNCRFGDPETQALMLGLQEPLLPILRDAAHGRLTSDELTSAPAVSVVLAAAGYPQAPVKGAAISGLEQVAKLDDVVVFHAGTTLDDGGQLRAAGGRVLTVAARGAKLQEAVERAYSAIEHIRFEGCQFRRDIAVRAL